MSALSSRVEIVPYQASWPAEFARIAATLSTALGGLAPRVDHIGSTSVPGLASKDRIDVQIGVVDLSARDAIVAALGPAGHDLRPDITEDHRPLGDDSDDAEWRKLFFAPAPGRRRTNVHVREIGRRNWRYALLFRDYLRAHSAAAAGYAEFKRRLAVLPIDSGTYADVKDPACDIIMSAAEEWAAATGWSP